MNAFLYEDIPCIYNIPTYIYIYMSGSLILYNIYIYISGSLILYIIYIYIYIYVYIYIDIDIYIKPILQKLTLYKF